MIIRVIPVGFTQANCYIAGCDTTKEAVIIDPGADEDAIKGALSDLGVTAKCIINTHGHADHIGANRPLGLPVLIHRLDADCLISPQKNMSLFFGFRITSPAASAFLEDGEKIAVGRLAFEVLHTPGHTPGSICLKTDKVVFTGDTLFAQAVGRTDLAGSSEKDLLCSIKNKLLTLDDDILIYPGHGEPSTIGRERKTNPFLA